MSVDERKTTQPLKAARRLENLIGRNDELQLIENIFRSLESPAVFYWEGPGGIGKTALLQAAKGRLAGQGHVVKELIDLYHVEHQSRTGIIQSIVRNLGEQAFTGYQKTYEELQKKGAGGVEIADAEWQGVWEAFLTDLERLSEQQPVLIALDTAEVLGYEQDRFHRDMGRELPELTVGKWLVDAIICRSHGRVLWLLSGRPADRTLYNVLEDRAPGTSPALTVYPKHVVQPLNAQESQEYFEAVIEFLLKSGKPLEAERIKNTLQQSAGSLYALSEGRPILLALIADILSQGGSLPDPGDPARRAHALLHDLLSLAHPLGVTLRTMAYLPKGVDAELLRLAIHDVEGTDISLQEAAGYLTAVSDLVLVKQYRASPLPEIEPADQRYFLHDELYELFERYQDNITATRRQLLPALTSYYGQQEQKLLDELRLEPPWERRDVLQRRRDVLRVERIYYQLLTDFDAGAEQYFLLAEDWMDARQKDAYLMLYTNIHRALRSLQQEQILKPGQQEMVDLNLAVRWGMGQLLFDNDPQGALELFNSIHQWPLFQQTHLRVPKWHLCLYKAVALIRLGQREEAVAILNKLDKAISTQVDQIKRQKGVVPESVTLLLALIYHYQGYVHRLTLDYYLAIEFYRKVIALFEQLQVGMLISEYEHFIYAMAQVGYFRRGRQAFYDALDLVKQQGTPHWEMRLQNVMMALETLDGHPLEAEEYGKQALAKLQQAPNPRWESLVCVNLARTYRNLWNRSVSLREWRAKWPETLKKAYELLETQGPGAILNIDSMQEKSECPAGALGWLREQAQQDKDEIYYVEALVEGGCIEREMAWLYQRYEKDLGGESSLQAPGLKSTDWSEWAPICKDAPGRAEAYFFEAAGLSKYLTDWRATHTLPEPTRQAWKQAIEAQIQHLGGGRYWPVLALVNLGWHWRYQREATDEVIEALGALVETLIPEEYHLPVPQKKRDAKGTELLLWAVLGKMEMLRFDVGVKFEEWQAQETLNAKARQELEKRFEQTIPHLVYSLAYNRLLGEAAFDRGRAEDGLSQRLSMIKQHHSFVIPLLYKYDEKSVRDVQSKYGDEKAGNEVTFPSELRRWLEERFGGPEVWVAQGGYNV